ncbi:MAG: DUF4134 domain-containing protein [Bacteroidales bacterium]|nr:DUF4134 domain-containing protein [Bacteroidales bacterium]
MLKKFIKKLVRVREMAYDRIALAIVFLMSAMTAKADGYSLTGSGDLSLITKAMQSAAEELIKYPEYVNYICLALGGATIGITIYCVYQKIHDEEQGVKKSLVALALGCIFLILGLKFGPSLFLASA